VNAKAAVDHYIAALHTGDRGGGKQAHDFGDCFFGAKTFGWIGCELLL
jgi:hypothetical protein